MAKYQRFLTGIFVAGLLAQGCHVAAPHVIRPASAIAGSKVIPTATDQPSSALTIAAFQGRADAGAQISAIDAATSFTHSSATPAPSPSLPSNYINVQDFGAKGDGVTDDTAAIQAAINKIKKGYYDKGGGAIFFPVPDRFYKVTSTLDLTEVWNASLICPARYNFHRQPAAQIDDDLALIHWFGPAGAPVLLFDYSFGCVLENISINGRSTAGVGVSLSRGGTANSSAKFISLQNVDVKYCDIGIRVGDSDANGPDDAAITLQGGYLAHNTSQGLVIRSGNAGVVSSGLMAASNGEAPSNGQPGANVLLSSGELTLDAYTSDGAPNDADIYQLSGGLRVENAWSDVGKGPFLISKGATSACQLTGVRHYDGAMTAQSTPLSIRWQGPQPLVLSGCFLYNNVLIDAGNMAHVIDIGTRFANPQGKFTGDMVDTYRGLISLGMYGQNEARLSVGKPPRTDAGSSAPLTVWSNPMQNGIVRTSDQFAVTETLNPGNNAYELCGNAYFENGVYKSVSAGPVWRLRMDSSGFTNFGAPDATSAGQVITWNEGFKSSTYYNGSAMGVGGHRIVWNSGIPTTGSWNQDDVVFNVGSTPGKDIGWVCVASGSPGIWKSLGTLRESRVVTTSPVTLTNADLTVFIKLSVPGPSSVILPSNPVFGQRLTIKDARGDAAANNITITPSANATIDGAPQLIIHANYGSSTLEYNGSEWSVL